MKKIFISLVTVILIALGSWSGAGIYAGVQVEKELLAFINQLPMRSPIRVVDVEHKRGLMNSTGQFSVRYLDPQAQGARRPDLITAVVNYDVDHHVSWQHLAKFTWRLAPTDAFAKRIKFLFATDFNVSGQGAVDWQGVAQTDFVAPPLRYEQGADVLAFGPWSGEMLLSGPTYNFLIQSPEVDIRSEDTFLKVKNINLKVDLLDRLQGVGASTLNIENISFPTTTIQGLEFKASNTLEQGYLNLEIEKKIKDINIVGQTITNVDLLLTFKHLNQQSMVELSNVMNEIGNFDNLTAAQQEIVQLATIRLIQDGFELGIPRLKAQTERGMIEGNALFNLAANLATPNEFDAAKQVNAEGKLSLARMIMPPEYEGLVQLLGLARRTDRGLESQFLFTDGKLLVNGRNIDVNIQLQRINQAIVAFLAKRS